MDIQFGDGYDKDILLVFLEEIAGYLPELDSQMARLNARPKDKEALEVAHRLAHTIKGTAASLGFNEVSKHGQALEQVLTPVMDRKATFTPELARTCQNHINDLKQLLAKLAEQAAQPAVTPVSTPAATLSPAPPIIEQVTAPLTPKLPTPSVEQLIETAQVAPVSNVSETKPAAIPLSSSWLDDAASLFTSDDVQPFDFIQKLEQHQQNGVSNLDATPGAVLDTDAALDLPPWLHEVTLQPDHAHEPPAHMDTPFLNTAGVPEAQPDSDYDFNLPFLDELSDFAQLSSSPAPDATLLPPVPLDVSSPIATNAVEFAPNLDFSQAASLDFTDLPSSLTREDEAAIEAELADLPLLEDWTAEEAAFDDDLGFEVAPMWLAEGQADIDRLGALLDGWEQPDMAEINQIAATLRKAAELMDLNEIANQLRVLETSAQMLSGDDLPNDFKSYTVLRAAYSDLLHLLEPYHDGAQAILNPPAQSAPDVPEHGEGQTSSTPVMVATEVKPPTGVEVDKELAEVFATEAAEHIQNLDSRLAALEKEPQNRELIREIRRTAHTLKGSAAMVGFGVVSQTGHLMEDLLDKLFDNSLEINSSIVELLFATFNAIEKMVRDLAIGQAEDASLLEALRPRYAAVLDLGAEEAVGGAIIFDHKTPSLVLETAQADTLVPYSIEDNLAATSVGLDMELAVRVPINRLDGMMNQVGELVINRTVLEQRSQIFNRTVEELSLAVRRLQRLSRDLETRYEVELLQSSSIGMGVPVGAGVGNGNGNGHSYGGRSSVGRFDSEFDTLEMDRYTEFHTLSREVSETVSDLATLQRELDNLRDDMDNVTVQQARLTDDLQDRLVKVRLVPLSNLTPRLYRTVRTIAASEHKEIEFVVSGDTTQVDKTIFEEISDPLLHLIRNAVDHGVETAEERQVAGKGPTAVIGFAARSEGSDVVIEVSDDGRGIDIELLKQRGIERGFLQPDAHPSEEDIYNLIFLPGFSTSYTISEISGRGVGLDVVKSNITRLKGSIEIASELGRGTTFIIRLPNTLAITRALLVQSAGYIYAIPLNVIEETTRLEQSAIVSGLNKGRGTYFRYNDKTIPLYNLSDLLHLPAHARRETDFGDDESGTRRERPLLIIAGSQPYALTVDKLEGQQEVVVKGLGNHLKNMRGVVGATILGSGQVIVILNVYELLDRSSLRQMSGYTAVGVRSGQPLARLETGRVVSEVEIRERELADLRSRDATVTLNPPPVSAPLQHTLTIQVVDDSLSIRKVLATALEKAGFRVRTSKDGQEALETIQQHTPDLIIMDIEMPRMDGYQLTSILKNDNAFQRIPIVMLTSRAGLKHRQKAEEVGADGFLVKPYREEELLGIVSQLLVRN